MDLQGERELNLLGEEVVEIRVLAFHLVLGRPYHAPVRGQCESGHKPLDRMVLTGLVEPRPYVLPHGPDAKSEREPEEPDIYNPDLIVIDADGTHWVVEVKMDKEMDTSTVKGKRDAARRWANYVTADETVDVPWRYLLASEADVETARGSWPALKALGES